MVFFAVPLAFGVLYRKHAVRPYAPRPEILLDPRVWAILARALLEQFGALALVAPVGLVLAWRRGRRDLALLLAGLVVGYALSMAMDGYACLFLSRFLLVLLPPLVIAAREVVLALAPRRATLGCLVLVAMIATDLALSPVSLGGVRQLFYGTYTLPNQELLYPFDEAIETIAQAPRHETVEVVGLDFGYGFDRSLARHSLAAHVHARPFPPDATERALGGWIVDRAPGQGLPLLVGLVKADLDAALASGADAVIAVVPPGESTSGWPSRGGGREARELAIGECRLLVYVRAPGD